MYTTREEIREKKKGAPQGEVWFPGWDFAERRQALPPTAAGRERKAGKGRKVCIFYMLIFSSFFCASLQTQKGMILLCISLCIYKKKKMYM